MRILACLPAVVVDGCVQGLGAVPDVVAEPAGIKEDRLFRAMQIFGIGGAGGSEMTVFAHGCFKALPEFIGLPGLQADLFRAFAVGKDGGFEIKAVARQRTEGIGWLKIDEMLWSLGALELRLSESTPTVGFWTEIFNLIESRFCAQEGWNVCGKIRGCETIHEPVPLVAPAESRGGADEKREYDGGSGTADEEGACRRDIGHIGGSISRPWPARLSRRNAVES